jgi:hypothetical protein
VAEQKLAAMTKGQFQQEPRPGKKLWQDAGAPRSFWNEDVLRDATLAKGPLVITEGEPDALAAIRTGFLRAVSVVDGANSNLDFLGELRPLLKDIPHVIPAGDGDEPGRKLNAELTRRFGAARRSWVAYPERTKDLNDILRLKGETAEAEAIPDQGALQTQRLPRHSGARDVRDGLALPEAACCSGAESSSSSPLSHRTARTGLSWSCSARWLDCVSTGRSSPPSRCASRRSCATC